MTPLPPVGCRLTTSPCSWVAERETGGGGMVVFLLLFSPSLMLPGCSQPYANQLVQPHILRPVCGWVACTSLSLARNQVPSTLKKASQSLFFKAGFSSHSDIIGHFSSKYHVFSRNYVCTDSSLLARGLGNVARESGLGQNQSICTPRGGGIGYEFNKYMGERDKRGEGMTR